MQYRLTTSLLSVLLLAAAVGCDKASPVAPAGTTLTLSANPSKIGLNGQSTITVVGRKPDGNPLNPGTEVRLSTDRGTIDPIVTIDDNGRATATLRGDGRAGTAAVKADAADASVTTNVQIGESEETQLTVLLSVTPSELPVNGTAEITVVTRNADNSPAGAGHRVLLTTTLGSISGGNQLQTRADGTARATLTAGTREGTATVTAVVGSSEAATAEVTIFRDAANSISLTANPAAVDSQTTTTVTLAAFVTNTQGDPLQGASVTFQTEFGTLEDNTVEITDASGTASKRFTVRPQDIPSGVESFEVKARTPSSTGSTLEDTTNIRVIRPPS